MVVRFLFVIALLFISAAFATPTILVFGDSLSAAYGIPQEKGWVNLLRGRLAQEKYGYQVINASISGETTAGGASRIETALTTQRPAIVILELGANDGLRGLPLADTQRNLASIIAASQKNGARVLLVGMRLPPNYGMFYAGKFQQLYADLAKRQRLAFVPFMLEGIADRQNLFQADGLHPIAQAQPRILETIWKQLRPLLSH